MNQQRLDKIQNILNTMVAENYIAGVNCLIYQHGEEQGYYQAGFADIQKGIRMERHTICHLYSLTKPITAAAVMLLLEDGQIDLLDPVEKYIPSFTNQMVAEGGELRPAKRSVVIKDLLNMQSGLVYPGISCLAEHMAGELFEEAAQKLGTEDELSTLQIADRIGRLPLAFQPGTRWQYGTSADILGAIVEVASGMKYGEFLKKRFFEPLGMKDTGFYVEESKLNRLSKAYEDGKRGLQEFYGTNAGINLQNPTRPPRFESGGGGLLSTAEDYMKFGQMLLNGGTYNGQRIMGAETVKFLANGRLPKAFTDDLLTWSGLEGFQYGNLMRVVVDPGLAMYNAAKGSYGWDGWLGAFFLNDPLNDVTVILMQQKTGTGTTPYTRKILNIMASALE